jgi:hypothetical protein
MTNPFPAIGHFFGKIALAVVAFVSKADQEVDTVEPEVAKVLAEGASVATLIPGVGPEVASILNAGIQLLGDAKEAVDGTNEILATAVSQAAALAPSGYSFVLIKADVMADVASLAKLYEAEWAKATALVVAVQPPADPMTPSAASAALTAAAVADQSGAGDAAEPVAAVDPPVAG